MKRFQPLLFDFVLIAISSIIFGLYLLDVLAFQSLEALLVIFQIVKVIKTLRQK